MNTVIRLLSLNVSLFDENNEKLSAFLKKTNPDLVCLQEVTKKVDASALDSYITKKAIDEATLQLPHSFYAPNYSLKHFKQHNFHGRETFEYDFEGQIECGNYIKSNYVIDAAKSIFVQRSFSYVIDWEEMSKHPGEEPRMVEVVDLKISEKQKLRILNYHGIWSRDKQGTDRTKAACQKIAKLAQEVDHPSIICGDFNLFPHTESMHVLSDAFESLVDTFDIKYTRPKSNELSGTKRNVVDYIIVSKGITVQKFEVVDSDVSDHLPLILDFEIQ